MQVAEGAYPDLLDLLSIASPHQAAGVGWLLGRGMALLPLSCVLEQHPRMIFCKAECWLYIR